MFELLVPAAPGRLESVKQDYQAYDLRFRPDLTVGANRQLQEAGVEPDVWRLDGTDDPEASRSVVEQARTGGRRNVGVIVLGRGEDERRVVTNCKA